MNAGRLLLLAVPLMLVVPLAASASDAPPPQGDALASRGPAAADAERSIRVSAYGVTTCDLCPQLFQWWFLGYEGENGGACHVAWQQAGWPATCTLHEETTGLVLTVRGTSVELTGRCESPYVGRCVIDGQIADQAAAGEGGAHWA